MNDDRKPASWLAPTVVAIASYPILCGGITLVGWFGGKPRLTDWMSSGISMFPNAALAAVCSGAGLILTLRASSTRVRLGGLLGLVVFLLSGATLFQHLTGITLGIDTLLIEPKWGAKAATAPGRMGPPASTSYTLIGLALILSAWCRSRLRRLIPGFGIGVCAIALLSLMGYVLGADPLFAVARFTGIAMQTATTVFALGIALVVGQHELEPMRTLRESSAAGLLARRSVPFIIGLPLILGLLGIQGQKARWFDTAMGLSLLLLLLIAAFYWLMWWWVRAVARHENALHHRSEQLATLVDRAPLGVYLIDADFRIVQVNPIAKPAFGDIPGNIIGRDLDEVIHLIWEKAYADEIVRIFRHTLETGVSYVTRERAEHRVSRKKIEYYEWQIDRIALPDGLHGLVCYFRDISEQVEARTSIELSRDALRESEARERAARTEAEQAAGVKDEFLATLSHELRTPLNAIVGWSQVIGRKPADLETVKKGTEVIRRNARMQADLIADLLDMSRITSGNLRLDMEDVNLSAVIHAAIDAVRHIATAKRIQIDAVLAAIVTVVRGDLGRLQQVVLNLLSNAVKFTPEGGRIRVLLEHDEVNACIVVSDTGIGIDAEFLPHLFQRFRQADASTSRRYGGLGLGLAIVKHLVDLHGGRVRAASDGEGKGATFTVELPVVSQRDNRSPHDRERSAGGGEADLMGIKVLAIDDDADARVLIRHILETRHADVILASSTDEGLEALQAHGPNVILCDIGMPGRDGLEFIGEMRRQGYRQPAVAVTAFARSEDKARVLSVGYHAHICKPFEASELVAAVAALAGSSAKNASSDAH
jgi:PAS domain S-box-containing protein